VVFFSRRSQHKNPVGVAFDTDISVLEKNIYIWYRAFVDNVQHLTDNNRFLCRNFEAERINISR